MGTNLDFNHNFKRNIEAVAITSCTGYDAGSVSPAMHDLIGALGGIGRFFSSGQVVAVKVNLVGAHEPEKAATTHPALVGEFCRMLVKEAGVSRIIVGDSPGGSFTTGHLREVYRKCGLQRVVEELEEDEEMRGKVALNFNTEVRDTDAHGVQMRGFSYTAWLDSADVIVNFCKLKTHGMLTMTCATKNLFGTIPGMVKPEYHSRFPDKRAFSNMLVDINEFFKPVLSICDSVIAMEGNGPTQGRPRAVGVLLASGSPYELDVVAANLIGLSAEELPLQQAAMARGLCHERVEEVELVGSGDGGDGSRDGSGRGSDAGETGEGSDSGDRRALGRRILEKARVVDFDRAGAGVSILFGVGPFSKIMEAGFKRLFDSRPEVTISECIGCGKCAAMCPAKAITIQGREKRFPVIDRSECIRCFCCQEFCPVGAMKVRKRLGARLLSGMSGHRK